MIITLLENDQQADQVFLDFARNFQLADPSAYTLRSKLVLNAAHCPSKVPEPSTGSIGSTYKKKSRNLLSDRQEIRAPTFMF